MAINKLEEHIFSNINTGAQTKKGFIVPLSQPRVSVCMSMYNASKFLRECIDSVLYQTFKDFEFIIVDDGSTDDSVDVVLSYHDDRIRLIRNNHDYIGSLNLLFEEARGKYIARMDADDIMVSNRLEIQTAYMEAHPDIDILGGSLKCFNKDNGKIIKYGEHLITAGDLLNGAVFAHPTVMMRISSIANLRYNENFIYAEDYHFWCQAFMAGLKMTNISDVLTKYRITNTNTSFIHRKEQRQAALKAKAELEEWVTEGETRYALPVGTNLPPSTKKLTVIITFLNEGEELERTLAGIRNSVADAVDIIVINDGSFDDYAYGERVALYDAHYIVNRHRLGVAASRDLGVNLCQTPFFLLLDAHMRFYDNRWADSIVKELYADERQIICCQGRYLYKDNKNNIVEENRQLSFGAFSPFARNNIWPDITWNYKEFHPERRTEEIPVILGAAYAASKSYWLRLRGLEGLQNYGADEQFISYKAWREGGKCTLLKDVIIGHIYRKQAPYLIVGRDFVYNLMLIAKLIFPVEMYSETVAISLVKNRNAALETLYLFDKEKEKFNKLENYFKCIFTREIKDILPMHQACRQYDSKLTEKAITMLPDIVQFLQKNIPADNGLMQGKAGILLWLFHYDKLNVQSEVEKMATRLYTAIETSINEKQLPWNFRYGVAGIGWVLFYLFYKKYIENIPESLISEIDSQLLAIDPERLDDISLETGATGILAYFTLRLTIGDLRNSCFSLEKWYKKAKDIFLRSNRREVIYYAHLFYTIYDYKKENRDIRTVPLLGIWLNAPSYLPHKITCQNCVLSNGILGTTLQIMSMEYMTKK